MADDVFYPYLVAGTDPNYTPRSPIMLSALAEKYARKEEKEDGLPRNAGYRRRGGKNGRFRKPKGGTTPT